MPDDATRSLMDGYLTALVTGGDFAEYFAPDVVWTFMESGDQIRGRDAVRDLIVNMHTQAFDARAELRGVLTGPGAATLEAVFVGTHTGEFAGVTATGTQVRVPYSVAYDIRDGAITALRVYFPTTALRALLAESTEPADAPARA